MPVNLPPAWTVLRPHELQTKLWRTKERFVAVAAGRGSGKTELARRRVVRMLPIVKPEPALYFYALPTRGQAKRVAWDAIKALVPKVWLDGDPKETDMTIKTIFGSTLHVVGMDKPQRIEGNQWDGGVVDESSDQKPGSFNRSIAPALTHKNGWCWRIGVPKRFGIGAAEFKAFCEREDVEHYSWTSEEIIPEEKLKWFRENLSEADYDEQFRARWLNAAGGIFAEFKRNVHVSASAIYNPQRPLIIGSDFNVDPMAWVISQELNIGGVTLLNVIDEIWLRNTNTQRTLDYLITKYKQHNAGWEFIGDATGRARKTSSNSSDFIQIQNDMRFSPKIVSYLKSNPPRADRFAACNSLFRESHNAKKPICRIAPHCVHLITDLENRAYEEGSNEPNDKGDIGHISDAFGYIVYKKYPIRFQVSGSTGISLAAF